MEDASTHAKIAALSCIHGLAYRQAAVTKKKKKKKKKKKTFQKQFFYA